MTPTLWILAYFSTGVMGIILLAWWGFKSVWKNINEKTDNHDIQREIEETFSGFSVVAVACFFLWPAFIVAMPYLVFANKGLGWGAKIKEKFADKLRKMHRNKHPEKYL